MSGRVLQVVAASRGILTQVGPLATGLMADGWDVDIACPDGPEVPGLAVLGVGHRPVEFSRQFVTTAHLTSLAALTEVMRKGRYRIVHLHGPIPGTLGRIAARLSGARAIYHCRGTLYGEPGDARSDRVRGAVFAIAERALASSTDWAFVLNASDARDLAVRAGIPARRITCLGIGGCGLNLATWDARRFDDDARRQARRSLGLRADAPLIGFLGRIVREKGVLELIEAFAQVRASGRDAQLLLIGDTMPNERDQGTAGEVRRRIDALGLGSHVVFGGYMPEPSSLVAAMDMLVLPSYREGFGQALAEAGAMAVPAIAASSRGAREAIVPGRTGLIVPKRDVAALAEAMRSLLDRPDLARRMGEEAAIRARDLWGRERWLETIREVYRGLPPGRPGTCR